MSLSDRTASWTAQATYRSGNLIDSRITWGVFSLLRVENRAPPESETVPPRNRRARSVLASPHAAASILWPSEELGVSGRLSHRLADSLSAPNSSDRRLTDNLSSVFSNCGLFPSNWKE